MSKSGIGLAALLAIAAMGSAQAVHLDNSGRGQVLLYPYYTVNNSQQTLVSVTNTSSVAQAAKVRFREGYNGRNVLNFNLFLSPFDSWTGTIFALRDAGLDTDGAAILTTDTSCTAPLFSEEGTSINGVPYIAFRDLDYLSPPDGGPYTIDRTREGMIEIIALSNVDAPLASAIAHGSNGSPPTGCAQVRILQGTEPALSSAPSGGLMGSISIINGGQGTYLSARAEALGGFTPVTLFPEIALSANLPDLNSTTDGETLFLRYQATAHVFDAAGKALDLTYPGFDPRSRKVDAVSAVLMADHIYNEYQVTSEIGASSDWVVTMPTKHYYTDRLYTGTSGAVPPFKTLYDGSAQVYSPVGVSRKIYTRDVNFYRNGGCGFLCPPDMPLPSLRFTTNVSPISKSALTESQVLGSQLVANLAKPYRAFEFAFQTQVLEAGWMDVNLDPFEEQHALLPSITGGQLRGLPVIGFWASNIVNANASNGVLANYAAAVRHATSVSCITNGTPCD